MTGRLHHACNAACVRLRGDSHERQDLLWESRCPSALQGVGMAERMSLEERELIQALMLQGWYRDGREPADSPHRGLWRFRAGHSLEHARRKTVLVRAPDQLTAMRAMLAWLRPEHGAGGAPAAAVEPIVEVEDIPPQPHRSETK